MPLPENNTAWPPPELAPQLRDMRVDDAWYSGDKTRLRQVYALHGYDNGSGDTRDGNGRPWRFWERPRPTGMRDGRLHVPLAADIASTSADLLFSEPPTFTVDNKDTGGRLDEILEEGGAANTLLEAAELAAALGGVCLRATWNTDLAQRPLLTAVHADGVIPTWSMGVMTSLLIWREVERHGNSVRRHLELHESGKVSHGLYEGTLDNLGRKVPLTEHEATADLVSSLGVEGDSITTGIKPLTAVYVPNMRPNRKYRGSMLGRSDWQDDGIRDLFMSLDETYTSWMRDIRLAKSRIIVPNGMLQSEGPGKGASFDDDREVWTGINASPTSGEGITENQFNIRVQEHEQTWTALIRQAVQSAGYSAQTFGLGDSTAVTATEVVARERRSMITRDRKGRYWAPELAQMGEVLLLLDRFLKLSSVEVERPRIEFGDSVSEDPKSVAETVELLFRAQAASAETRVRIAHPDWEDKDVKEEADRILKETGALVNDPTTTGAEGPGPGFPPAGGNDDPEA
ncbi:phage portal protein [Streptomyces scabiei]|uniref:phage portal protein n=1 Tax=Streptomyces scabiei TaxID=1930 RepID=UPI0029B6E936|nr:phage portal protein [Streptomyces scabiei]MDX3028275.1 phage portal protein [Streptomyces scabiei]